MKLLNLVSKKIQTCADNLKSHLETLDYRVEKAQVALQTAYAAGKDAWNGKSRFEALDYVFIKEDDNRYRVVHSYYPEESTHVTAEEALAALSLCANFNIYAVVAFKDGLLLDRRKK